MQPGRLFLLVAVALLIGVFFALDLDRYLSLEQLEAQQNRLVAFYEAHPARTVALYFVLYVALTALSLPVAAVLTLAGGALFGLLVGTVVVSFASAIGAAAAFLVSRYLLRDAIERRFGNRLRAINAGVTRDGAFYLFALRLVPAFPFFVINLVMGLTAMRTWTFYWVSQAGMLPATVVFVNAGTQLADVESVNDVLSPDLLLSFALLGLFPLIARRVVAVLRARRVYRRWPRPRAYERNLIVIGGGAAGLVAAYIAAAARAKVTLIEGHRMGGDCLNYGCVPSKALLRSARLVHEARHAQRYGLAAAELRFDFADIMERVQRVIRTIAPNDSAERYTRLGVEVIQGRARITSPWTVEVNGRTLTTRAIVIAAGSQPAVPPIPGLRETPYYTAETVWSLRALPRRVAVLGGGPAGCELAQAFARLGAQVTQVELEPRLLTREDPEVSAAVERALAADGVRVLTGHKALRCERRGDAARMVLAHAGGETALEYDALLCLTGRVPRTQGYGLEELGIPLSARRTIEADAYLQTLYPNIYACGDVAGPYQLTHAASHQAWHAAVNALFGGLKRIKVDYAFLPWCIYTDPEIARVGLSEQEARARGVPYEITRYDLADLDRAIADEAAHGFIKVLTPPGRDRILGVAIVGAHAGELLAEYTLAMKHGLGLGKILATIHPYPTLSEANTHAAGAWRRAHVSARLLGWAARYHAWRRRGRAALEQKAS